MSGALPPLPQSAFMALCLVKAQGQLYLYLYLHHMGLKSLYTGLMGWILNRSFQIVLVLVLKFYIYISFEIR
jgi:hypothetical protein